MAKLVKIPNNVNIRAHFGYEAASSGRRTAGWNPTSHGPNTLLSQSLDKLRDRSNDLTRQNPYAAAILDKWVSNAIGTGIDLRFRHPKRQVREVLKKRWTQAWSRVDFDQQTDMGGLQALAFRTMVVAGEGLGRFRRLSIEEARERGISLQLELLEADHLPTQLIAARGVGEGNRVVCGIEVDDDGRRVAYHLYRDHPNEYYLNGRPVDTVRVPAEEVMHIFRIMRPKQLRGEPWFVRVMMRLLQIDKYDDAELARKNFAASLTAFVTSTAPDDQRPLVPTGAEPQSSSPGQQTIELEPGSVIDLAPDESITIADVDDVGGMYPDFMRQQLRAIASGCGLTYEQVTGDMSMVNYSSIRAGSLEFRRLCEQVQYANFIPQFCSRYVREWLRAEALLGTIDARDYLANREQYEDVEWITPGWDWVDPLKDITAHIMAIEAGLTSRQIVVTSRGLDKERVDRDNIEDKEWQQREGVEYGSKKKTDEKATKSRSKTKRLPKSTVTKEIVQ